MRSHEDINPQFADGYWGTYLWLCLVQFCLDDGCGTDLRSAGSYDLHDVF